MGPDITTRVLEVLATHAHGKPTDWDATQGDDGSPSYAHRWPENGALNIDWLRALYVIKYGYPDAHRLFGGKGPFIVDGHVMYESGCSAAFQSAMHALIADGVLEFTVDPKAYNGHRIRYTLPILEIL
jgi:hypothetical protein